MIELTLERREAVATGDETPLRVIDPSTHTQYVLVRGLYDRVRQVFE